MEMIDTLTPFNAGVDDTAVTSSEPLLFGDVSGCEQQVTQQGLILS